MRTAVLFLAALLVYDTHPASRGPLFAPAPGSPVRVGSGSGTIILADVNGDAHLDMVTRHLKSRIVAVQIGNGQGGFTAAATSPIVTAYRPGDMKLGDFNDDGVLDLVVTASDRDIVDVLVGNGRGQFSPAPGSPFTVSTAVDRFNKRSLHVVDINEDGNLDIVTANGRQRNTFAALFGNGRGAFSPGPTVRLDSGRDRYAFAFGDIDADGHLDVVTASSGIGSEDEPGRVVVQSGDGKGAFTHVSWSPLPVPPGPRVVTIADMNGDQRLDIVITHGSGLLSVLLNAGNGRCAPAPGSPFNLGTEVFASIVVDLNRDQKPDLVAATADSVAAFLGDGRGGYAPAPGSPFTAGPGAYNLSVADVNEDGKLDVAASSFEGNGVTLLLGQ